MPAVQTTKKSGGWPNQWQWLLIMVFSAIVCFWFQTEAARRQREYGPWFSTIQMVRALLPEHLSPELVASVFGKNGPPAEGTLLRSDWPYDAALIQAMDLHPSMKATPNKDGWGTLYYAVFDFNRDGLVPHPEALLDPKQGGSKQPVLNSAWRFSPPDPMAPPIRGKTISRAGRDPGYRPAHSHYRGPLRIMGNA